MKTRLVVQGVALAITAGGGIFLAPGHGVAAEGLCTLAGWGSDDFRTQDDCAGEFGGHALCYACIYDCGTSGMPRYMPVTKGDDGDPDIDIHEDCAYGNDHVSDCADLWNFACPQFIDP